MVVQTYRGPDSFQASWWPLLGVPIVVIRSPQISDSLFYAELRADTVVVCSVRPLPPKIASPKRLYPANDAFSSVQY